MYTHRHTRRRMHTPAQKPTERKTYLSPLPSGQDLAQGMEQPFLEAPRALSLAPHPPQHGPGGPLGSDPAASAASPNTSRQPCSLGPQSLCRSHPTCPSCSPASPHTSPSHHQTLSQGPGRTRLSPTNCHVCVTNDSGPSPHWCAVSMTEPHVWLNPHCILAPSRPLVDTR